ncbi:hypothetical protein LIER_39023 [Lithospermum erythrorhizon]|uniref:Retrovirus-related Pol polyprotein from transposon TNT 1-94 n=1 Tax=Lithospermum erythrorhizon TaxID=34254 RepID=A0AAV3QAU8_LITER
MKDLGHTKHILGMEIRRDRAQGRLWLSQKEYMKKVIKRFNMESAKSVSCPLGAQFKLSSKQCPVKTEDNEYMKKVPYASAVGSIMYVMTCTRPDLRYAIVVLSRFLSNPGNEYWEGIKWILRYLKRTVELCIGYGRNTATLQAYTDADMAGDIDSKRSTSGYVFVFAGGAVSWQSKL